MRSERALRAIHRGHSESDSDAESHLPLVWPGAGDLGITSQRIHAAIGIQAHVGDVGAGIVEMRRIRGIGSPELPQNRLSTNGSVPRRIAEIPRDRWPRPILCVIRPFLGSAGAAEDASSSVPLSTASQSKRGSGIVRIPPCGAQLSRVRGLTHATMPR